MKILGYIEGVVKKQHPTVPVAYKTQVAESIRCRRGSGESLMPKWRAVLAAVLFLGTLHSLAQVSESSTTTVAAQQRKTSEPYTGDLSIFESPGRDERLQIARVMDILGIAPGKSVADVGAGSGWFTIRAAKRVGAGGEVYAVDINPEAVQHISERAKGERLMNVKTIQSKPDDALLPENSVDAVLLLKTYHEVASPVELLRNLKRALRPGAKVGVIDRNGNGENHGVGSEVVIAEAKEAGYDLAGQYDFVKDGMDYFLVFSPKR